MYHVLYAILMVITLCIFIIYMVILRRRINTVGTIVITEREGITLFSLELDGPPEDLKVNKEVIFKISIPDVESDRK